MLLIVLVAIAALLLLIVLHPELPTPRRLYYFYRLPGPWGVPIFGRLLPFFKPKDGSLEHLKKLQDIYGRICAIYYFGVCWILLKEPNDIMLLYGSQLHVLRGQEFNVVAALNSGGIIANQYPGWQERRKLLMVPYYRQILPAVLSSVLTQSQEMVTSLTKLCGESVAVYPVIGPFINAAIAEVAGLNKSGEQQEEFVRTMTKQLRITSKLSGNIWSKMKVAFLSENVIPAAFKTNQTFIYSVLNQALKRNLDRTKAKKMRNLTDDGEFKNFMQCLLEVQEEKPEMLTNQDIMDETKTFIITGNDSTRNALFYCLLVLGKEQEIQERLVEELKVLGDWKDLKLEDFAKLKYLGAVIKEVLRLYPSAPYLNRKLSDDLVLGDGTILPSGSTVAICPYLIHRLESNFENPLKFNPDRFLNSDAVTKNSYAYMPFSGGPRACIGKKIAMVVLKVFLARVVSNFRIEAVTKMEDLNFLISTILKVDKPTYCRFIQRKPPN